MSRRIRHPVWCAADHSCTAEWAEGKHRSEPASWVTAYGLIIATRTQTIRGRSQVELRAVVNLDQDEVTSRSQMTRVVVGADLAVRKAIGGRSAVRRAVHPPARRASVTR